MNPNFTNEFTLPAWLPEAVRLYLDHTGDGVSIRELARRQGAHASTVMRKVRRCELMREDPLVDEAFQHLELRPDHLFAQELSDMTVPMRPAQMMPDEVTLAHEGRRVLRRLAEPGAMLAIAADMETAVIMRQNAQGESARLGVVSRAVAQAFAIKDWISCRKSGRVAIYDITAVGRTALRRLVEAEDRLRQEEHQGMCEAAMPFAAQHRIWAEREVVERDGAGSQQQRRIRYNLAESPIALMGRRRDKDGKPFLDADLIAAAERLREDFELAQMGPRVTQNWERFLTGGEHGAYRGDGAKGEGPGQARERVAAALRDLGPGLGDVALRVCCFLEGIEAAERKLGWAARSGKVVLRIALERLRRHYHETYGKSKPMIG